MYLGAGNAYMREVGAALDDGFANGVLPQRPAVVNLQCDIDHPTQSMADLAVAAGALRHRWKSSRARRSR